MATGDIQRWLYRGGRPNALARAANWVSETLGAAGAFGDLMVRLETTGRKSGKSYSLPVVIAVVDGERYLVSMLGENVNWVRNVRAADGRATLQWGRREEVRLVEVPLAEFEAIAADFPVFRITPADAAAAS